LVSRRICTSASNLARASSSVRSGARWISSRASRSLPWRAVSDARRCSTSSARCGLSTFFSHASAAL
jgi:hypothetical protein